MHALPLQDFAKLFAYELLLLVSITRDINTVRITGPPAVIAGRMEFAALSR